jgi:hypothetical protein
MRSCGQIEVWLFVICAVRFRFVFRPLEPPVLLSLVLYRVKLFTAFNGVLDRVFGKPGVLGSFLRASDLAVLLGGLLTLRLRRLKDRPREWVDL